MEIVRCLLESGREEVGKEWPLDGLTNGNGMKLLQIANLNIE